MCRKQCFKRSHFCSKYLWDTGVLSNTEWNRIQTWYYSGNRVWKAGTFSKLLWGNSGCCSCRQLCKAGTMADARVRQWCHHGSRGICLRFFHWTECRWSIKRSICSLFLGRPYLSSCKIRNYDVPSKNCRKRLNWERTFKTKLRKSFLVRYYTNIYFCDKIKWKSFYCGMQIPGERERT